MDNNRENETSNTTQYPETFLRYLENEYCAKHQRVQVNKLNSLYSSNPILSIMASGSWQLCFDRYDSSCDDEELLTPTNVAERTLGHGDGGVSSMTAARLCSNSPSEAPNT